MYYSRYDADTLIGCFARHGCMPGRTFVEMAFRIVHEPQYQAYLRTPCRSKTEF